MNARAVRRLTVEDWRRIAGRTRDLDAEARSTRFLSALTKSAEKRLRAILATEIAIEAEHGTLSDGACDLLGVAFSAPDRTSVTRCCVSWATAEALIDIASGGAGEAREDAALRKFTAIDRDVVGLLLGEVAAAMIESSAALLERTLPAARDAMSLEESGRAFQDERAEIVRLALSFGDVVLHIQATMPPAVAREISRGETAARQDDDADWRDSLARTLSSAPIDLSATIEESNVALSSLEALRAGHVLPLQASPQTGVVLTVEGRPLFSCRLGQASGRYTIAIDRDLFATRNTE
jgi:flagellar motor switch protein FliM